MNKLKQYFIVISVFKKDLQTCTHAYMHAYYLRILLDFMKTEMKIMSISKQFELHERFCFGFLMNMRENL